MKRAERWICWVLAASLLACGSPQVLTVQEERQLGDQQRSVVNRSSTLMRDRVVVTYVRRLGEELLKHSRPSPFEPRFAVIEESDPNAFVIFGGSVYVSTGMILAADNVSQLAGVIAHEIGHATERHLARSFPVRRRTNFIVRFLQLLISIVSGRPYVQNSTDLLTTIGAQAYLNAFGREDEREADALAIETLVAGGYDPHGMTKVFEKLKEYEPRGVPAFLLSHPLPQERIDNVEKMIAEAGNPEQTIATDEAKFKAIQARIRLIQGLDTGLDDLSESEDEDLDDFEDGGEGEGEGGAQESDED